MDSSLITRAANDDAEAFCELVRSCQAEVFRLCYFYTGKEESAYNVAADSFQKIRNAISLYPRSEDFHLWMIRIVCNTCMASQYRKGDSIQALVAILRTRLTFSESETAYVLDLHEDDLRAYEKNFDVISELTELSGTPDLASGFRSYLKAEKQHRSPLKVLSHFRFTILAILIILIMVFVAHIQSASSEKQSVVSTSTSASVKDTASTSVTSGQFLPADTASDAS